MSGPAREDRLAAFARSLTVAGLARTLVAVGTLLAALAATRLAGEREHVANAWIRLACAGGWVAIGAGTLATAALRRRDWRARGRAPIAVLLATLVVGPLAVSGHHARDLIDLAETLLSGPTLGLCILLDGLLLRESVVTREDVEPRDGTDGDRT